MILMGSELLPADPAATTLAAELAAAHRRLLLLVAGLDPATVPQGVADGLHDAIVALGDAAQVMEATAWGWGAA